MATFTPLIIGTGIQLLASLFKKPTQSQEVDLRSPNVGLGSEIPTFFGRTRISGKIFFPKTTDKLYRVESSSSKGKGGFNSVTEKKVYGTWATLFCANQCSVDKLIINGLHITPSHPFYQEHCTFFDGTQTNAWSESQVLYPGFEGDIVYKGLAYIGFKDVNCTDSEFASGGMIPQSIDAVLLDSRLGEEPSVGYVVQQICEDAGIPNSAIDITEIIPLILKTGINVVQTGEGFRAAIEQLMQFYQFSAVERNGKVVFKLFDRGNDSPYVITPDHFLPMSDDMGNIAQDGSKDRHFIRKKGKKQDLPNKVTVKFFNQNVNYEQEPVTIPFGEFTKENILNIDTTISSYPYEIEERAIELLKMNFLQNRLQYSFKLPVLYDFVESMDTLQLPNGEVCQIQSKTNGNDFTLEFQAFYYSGQKSYSIIPNYEQSPTIDNQLPNNTTLPDVYILDIPQIEDYPPATLYLLASLPATLNFSFDNGDSYPDSVNHIQISTIGDCDTALPNVVGLDLVNTLDITLTSGDVEQITQNQFDNGQNLALLATLNGNGFYEGKFIRFRDISLLAPNQYRLSYLFQGDSNTSGFDTSSLPLKFFLLRSPTTSYYSTLTRNTSNINSPLSVLPVVSQWQDLGTTPTTNVTGFNNNSYVAPPVTNISSEKDSNDADSNVEITWDDTYNNTSPYQDGTEYIQYSLNIYSDASYTTLARTEIVNKKNYVYKGTERVTDGVSLPFYVRIARISSIVGEGTVTEATLNPTLSGTLTGFIDADLLQGENGAYYLDRTNHTGTQLSSSISDLSEAIDDRVDALLQEGTNISLDYDDTANTLTINNSQDLSVVERTITANHIVESTDLRKHLIVTTADITITLPNSFPVGFEGIVRNDSTGNVTFDNEVGGTIEGVGTIIDTQYRTAHFYHSGSNVWKLTGWLTTP